jgi:thioredoxin reductase (NADPH)
MLDTVIIGAGPAGLTAANYLARFHRRAIVIDGGASRARWIPESHNIPAFAQGIGGTQLLSQLRQQALRYGAEIRSGHVDRISRRHEGFRVHIGAEELDAHFVLLGTGVQDHLPEIAGAEEALLRSVLRICPICDAFEATGKRIAVVGSGKHGDREAQFLRTYSERVTLVHIGGAREPGCDQVLRDAGIAILESQIADLQVTDDRLSVRTANGLRYFDVFYSALGCKPMTELARPLGATVDEHGALQVNEHQQTSVAGIYAAGDLVRGLNQVVVAAAEAAIAATDIHNKLRVAADRT